MAMDFFQRDFWDRHVHFCYSASMRHSSCKTIQVPDVVREGSLGARCAEYGRFIFVGDWHVQFCYSA